jgi:hypothetical protein
MERTVLDAGQRLEFAGQALAVRFPKDQHGGMEALPAAGTSPDSGRR